MSEERFSWQSGDIIFKEIPDQPEEEGDEGNLDTGSEEGTEKLVALVEQKIREKLEGK